MWKIMVENFRQIMKIVETEGDRPLYSGSGRIYRIRNPVPAVDGNVLRVFNARFCG